MKKGVCPRCGAKKETNYYEKLKCYMCEDCSKSVNILMKAVRLNEKKI